MLALQQRSEELPAAITRRDSIDRATAEAESGGGDYAEAPRLEIELFRVTNQPRPTVVDLAWARKILDENCEPVSDVTWDTVRRMIDGEQWSAEQLRSAVDHILRTKTWIAQNDKKPRWQVGDFFKAPVAKVYGHVWYIEQISPPDGNPGNKPMIGMYRIDGHEKPVFGWKREVGQLLPVWNLSRPDGRAEAEATADDDDAGAERIDAQTRRLFDAEKQLAAAEEENIRLRQQVREYRDGGALEWRGKYEEEQRRRFEAERVYVEYRQEANAMVKRLLLEENFYHAQRNEYLRSLAPTRKRA